MLSSVDATSAIISKLHESQAPCNKRLLFVRQAPLGLGAQISGRLLWLRIGLAFGRRVVFQSWVDYPYTQIFEKMGVGPVLSYEEFEELPIFNFRDDAPNAVGLDVWTLPKDFSTSGFMNRLPQTLSKHPLGELLVDGILFNQLKIIKPFDDYIESEIRRLGSLDECIGVHFRRGDKKVETPYVPSVVYRSKIVHKARTLGLSKVFIASDNASAVAELKLPVDLEIIFDSAELRLNNANHKFLIRNPAFSERETRTALKNIILLSRCKVIVGQDNAHFATLAAGLILARGSGEIELIPGDIQLKKSRFMLRNNVNQAIRNLAKKALPGFTIQAAPRKWSKRKKESRWDRC